MNLLIKYILKTLLFSLILFSNSVMGKILFTHEGDSIAYDESNNHFIITYVGLQGEINEVIWIPPTDINVEVKTKYEALKNGRIKYEYTFDVDKTSKLDLGSIYFYALAVDKTSIKVPKKWRSLVDNSYEQNDPEQRISWFSSAMLVQAGQKMKGIELESTALPVYGVVYTAGETGILSYVDHGPNVDTQNYFHEEILAKHFNGKVNNTAISLIPVSVPFNPVETYTAFHKYLLDYIEKGFIDASIAISLTDASTAVLTALTLNDVNSALSKLKAVKKLIEGEGEGHKNEKGNDDEHGKPQPLILKELRKILKFNIKYIKKKLKGDSEED